MARPTLTLATRLRKLRALSADELRRRATYAAFCAWERRRHHAGALSQAGRLHAALRPDLARRAEWAATLLDIRASSRSGFFAGALDRAGMIACLVERHRDELAASRAEVERVLSGSLSFFGSTFALPDVPDWNRDPVSGSDWPRRYHRDVPIHGGDRGFGDVKYVWELNRHQFLVDLAKAHFVDEDPRCYPRVRHLLRSWLAQCPYGTGVNWACALEPAFRSLSWLWSYQLMRDAIAADEPFHLEWLAGFHDHGHFLYRHLEYYASPFNHLLGEATALYLLGLTFPEFSEAGAWRTRGRQVLEDWLPWQFYADGGTHEQSTFYHHASVGFYLLAVLQGRHAGEEFSPAVWSAIERGIEFSMHMQQPDGTMPRIGGADDGKPIRLEARKLWDFRAYQAIGAAVFGRGDFKAAAGAFAEDALWLTGVEGRDRFEALGAVAPPASVALPSSGYHVMRSADRADHVCVDCGDQAFGLRTDAIPNAVHGHADCLSVVAWIAGQPLLVDSGLFCYNGPPPWETMFRRTTTHNTMMVDGADQSQHVAKMAWSHAFVPRCEHWRVEPGDACFVGSHSGYRRLTHDLVHRRLVRLLEGGVLVVVDELTGSGRHDVSVGWQFPPGARVSHSPAGLAIDGRVEAAWVASTALSSEVVEGGATPADGWVAPSLGVRLAAPRLMLRGADVDCPIRLMTVFANGTAGGVADTRVGGGTMTCDVETVSGRRYRIELSMTTGLPDGLSVVTVA